MLSRVLLPLIAVVGIGSSSALAQYDETRIRQASQNLEVRGNAGAPVLFSVSGYLSDVVTIQSTGAGVYLTGTMDALRTNGAVYDVIRNSSGQYTLRFCLFPAPANLSGGTVAVTRGGVVIDRDRIVLN